MKLEYITSVKVSKIFIPILIHALIIAYLPRRRFMLTSYRGSRYFPSVITQVIFLYVKLLRKQDHSYA